ncbi:LysR substrate-binding domain-containing protein [Nonomuraea thailandensis]
MPLAVRAFLRERPGVSVELVEADRDEAVAAVAAHELDLALVYEFPAVPLVLPSNVEVRPLLVDPLYIALPPGHRQAGRARVRLADLAGERWIQGCTGGPPSTSCPRRAGRRGSSRSSPSGPMTR